MKRFLHKIYDTDGSYVATLDREIVTNNPSFTWSINGGQGQMVLNLALTIRDFVDDYENSIIKLGYEVRTFIVDRDTNKTIRIYTGEICNYQEIIDEEGKQSVNVTLLSFTKKLQDFILKEDDTTTLTYNSKDPSAMMRNIISNFSGGVDYTGSSIEQTGTVATYEFVASTYLEAINKVIELCPYTWFWYLDQENIIHLTKPPSDNAEYQLYIGKEVNKFEGTKSIEDMYNTVYFVGGGDPPLYKKYSHSGAIDEFGIREYKQTDSRVTNADTAETMAERFLDENDIPRSLLKCQIIDNNIDGSNGFDIELLRPGQIIQILDPHAETNITYWDFTWDEDSWDYDFRSSLGLPLQVIQIDYKYHYADVILSLKRQDVTKRIEDINRNLEVQQENNLPNQPN